MNDLQYQIGECLTWRYRLTTPEMEAPRFDGDERAAMHAMHDMVVRLRVADRCRMLIAMPPPITGPLHVGDQDPDFRAMSAVALARIQPPKLVTVYYQNERGANFFGGTRSGIPSREAAGHDLGVTRIYHHFLENRREEVAHWIGEDSAEKGQKTPDAIIASTGTWVEYVGAYPALRLAELYCLATEKGVRVEYY